MNKTLNVLKNELTTILSSWSFWLTTLGLPLIAGLIFGVIGLFNNNESNLQIVREFFQGSQETRVEGYVDEAGLIREIPAEVPAGRYIPFVNEQAARRAMEAGEIEAYYVLPADYIEKGEIRYIHPEFNPFALLRKQSHPFTWVVHVNLAGGNQNIVDLPQGPKDVEEIALGPTIISDEENPLAIWVPYAFAFLYFTMINGSATLLLSSVSKEKENRLLETLLTSTTPSQLLIGKIISLGLIGLFQAVLWSGTMNLLLNRSAYNFNLPSEIHIPPSLLVWGAVFFLLGYAVYASLLAGLGALAPNLREASQATFIILLPLLIPWIFSNTIFFDAPHGVVATGLSMFPLSAPVAIMARLSIGGVAWWQPPLAAFLMVVTVVLILRAVVRMFRGQILLSGQPFKFKTYLWALISKE